MVFITSDALELEFHEPSRPELKIFRAEPSRAELDILEKRAESELDFLKKIFKFFPRILSYSLEFFKREGNILIYIRAK